MAMRHYEGKLGSFDYDDSQFRIDEKEIQTLETTGEQLPDGSYKIDNGKPRGVMREPYLHYIGSETDGRRINIPDGLLSAENMFEGNNNLTYGARIPSSVRSVDAMYAGCENLRAVPDFPDGVETYDATFYGCENLREAPKLSKNGRVFLGTFTDCKFLREAPWIPENAKLVDHVFDGCSPEVQSVDRNRQINREMWSQLSNKWNGEHPGDSFPPMTPFNMGVLYGVHKLSQAIYGDSRMFDQYMPLFRSVMENIHNENRSFGEIIRDAKNYMQQNQSHVQHVLEENFNATIAQSKIDQTARDAWSNGVGDLDESFANKIQQMKQKRGKELGGKSLGGQSSGISDKTDFEAGASKEPRYQNVVKSDGIVVNNTQYEHVGGAKGVSGYKESEHQVSNNITIEHVANRVLHHSSRHLGDFNYDPTQFEIIDGFKENPSPIDKTPVYYEQLRYIGKETDGSKIHIPEGLISIEGMFPGDYWKHGVHIGTNKLESAPAIPKSVIYADNTFDGCSLDVKSEAKWNLKNRGKCAASEENLGDYLKWCEDQKKIEAVVNKGERVLENEQMQSSQKGLGE